MYIPEMYMEGRVSQNYDIDIKRDIRVEKIKVKILVINLPLTKYKEFRQD